MFAMDINTPIRCDTILALNIQQNQTSTPCRIRKRKSRRGFPIPLEIKNIPNECLHVVDLALSLLTVIPIARVLRMLLMVNTTESVKTMIL